VRNWRVNAALFQANTSDELVVLTNQGGRSTFQNASSTRRRGLEAALAGSWAGAGRLTPRSPGWTPTTAPTS
jgi:iron complex outermembrane receptor protein